MTVRGPAPKTVILVEPDAASRDAFQRSLNDAGFTVLGFPDYSGALQTAESERRLDLLVTGLRLPPGTPHGLSLAAMIHMRRPRLPVLFIADDAALAGIAGPDASVLIKPVDGAGLVEVATRLMNAPALR